MRTHPLSHAVLFMALLASASAAVAQQAPPAKGFNELGVMAFGEKRYELALENFGKALELEANNPSIKRNLCAVHQAMANDLAVAGKLPEALARVNLGLDVDPENVSALAQAGAYRLKQGDLTAATTQLEQAVALDGSSKEARFLLGEAYYQQNKLTEARAQWDEVLKLDPAWPGLQEKMDKLSREDSVEADFTAYDAGHFQLRYAEALSEATRDGVFRVLEEAYKSVGEKLGGAFPAEPVQVVLYDGEQFTEATQSAAHVGALFDGKIRAPITGKNKRFLTPQVLSTRLTHEYVHVVLAQIGGGRVPWWLNEGLAETFSRQMDQSRQRLLRKAYAAEPTPTLADLEARQLDQLEPEELAMAYAQAHAATQVLWNEGGTKKMADAIRRIKDGASSQDAIREAFGMDYAALEEKVKAAYK
jgi:Flp pilus assembly protein TadD